MERSDKVKKFLNMIKKQEGGKLHRNKSESDITTGYGIYREAFKDAEIFQYIDTLAKENNIQSNSSEWTKEEINLVNEKIDKEIEDKLTEEFYINNYFKKIDIFELPVHLTLAVGSTLVNGQKLGSKALQQAYNIILKKYKYRYPNEFKDMKEISEDGIIGPATRDAVYKISKAVEELGIESVELFFSIYLSCVKSLYVDLATDTGKDDKHLQYLRGWVLNRCDSMIKNIDNLVR